MSETTESTGKFSLTRKIAAMFKLGENGKLDSFFERVVKSLKKEKTLLTKNLDNAEFNHKQALDNIDDKLEDAKDTLQEAYTSVDLECIKTNELQKDHVEVYLSGIEGATKAVQLLEKEREKLIEAYKEEVGCTESRVSRLAVAIKRIAAE